MPPQLGGQLLWIEERPSDLEWDLFQQCEPFVFADAEPFDVTHDAPTAVMSWRDGYDSNPGIDAPFKVFSIEHLSGGALDFFQMKNGERRETLCVIVIEILPKQYGYYALCRDGGDPRQEFKVFKSNMEGSTVSKMLERLHTEKVGSESVRCAVKIGSGDKKRTHRIRRITHVWPKKLVKARQDTGMEKHIDWSHRWTRRGHWVSLPGRLGKDREGVYCVRDWTWRSEHEVGPEHLPLVKKVRVVEENKNE